MAHEDRIINNLFLWGSVFLKPPHKRGKHEEEKQTVTSYLQDSATKGLYTFYLVVFNDSKRN
jgi:hypothetical protein